MRNSYKKEEKLKKSKLIELLFARGAYLSELPIRLIYLEFDHDSSFKIQAGVSVGKRDFKKAVDRNKIKRLLREVYRINKHIIYESEHTKKHLFMFIYIGKKELKYDELEVKMKIILNKFLKKVEKN